jgi:eukaryotic-like serine/threonine-protein kinase
MKFTYRWGQRPLDGFTIKRGLGQGGFGEVYFAVSDGGKEVALKLIRGHSDTELRGIANCLNLKHPHLVHLYDLRTDMEGHRWLVMEYVHGESLSGVLNRNPSGLPEAQAREWFLQAARAVAYLHDHAVIHRDIKPGNLFVESGLLKLGDYGLSKTVGSSQVAQSSNVGTIHYMAPEIASGNYSKYVDIYACGVMLYEMLTGEVPFKGESWAEIAIKHQTDTPKFDRVPEAYRGILDRALDKNAARRYRDMHEFIQALETQVPGSIPVAQVLSDTITHVPPQAVPQTVLQPVAGSAGSVGPAPSRTNLPATRPGKAAPTWRSKLSELANAMAVTPLPAFAAVLVWAVFSGRGTLDWPTLFAIYLLTIAATWLTLVPAKVWEGEKSPSYRRLKMAAGGILLGLFALWLEGWTMPKFLAVLDDSNVVMASADAPMEGAEQPATDSKKIKLSRSKKSGEEPILYKPETVFLGYLAYFGSMFFLLRWWHNAERYREEKFSVWPIAGTALAAYLGLTIIGDMLRYPMPPNYVIVSLAGAAGVIQLVSPWSERPPRKPKKMRLPNA